MQRLIVCVCVCELGECMPCRCVHFWPCLFTMRQAGNQLASPWLPAAFCCFQLHPVASFYLQHGFASCPGEWDELAWAAPLMCSSSSSRLAVFTDLCQCPGHRFQFNRHTPFASSPPPACRLFCARIFRVYLLHMFLLNSFERAQLVPTDAI